MTLQNITGIIPMAMGVGLVSHNLKALKKKKQSAGDMLELGATNIIGLGLIQATADFT